MRWSTMVPFGDGLPSANDVESWFVPMQSARLFHSQFRDCRQPDTSGVGGCPHSFDAPAGTGNHVNARYLLGGDAENAQAAWFAGDASQRCGPDCYRQPGQPGRAMKEQPPTPAACMTKVNECIDACLKNNTEVSGRCIELGGSPIGGLCTENVDACSCTQTAPECRRRN